MTTDHSEEVEEGDVLQGTGDRWGMGQCAREGLATFDPGFAPHDFLHPLAGLHPRTARFAPSGGAGNRLFQAKLVGELGGKQERVFPLGCHVDQTLVHQLGSAQRRVEVLETTDADAVHPFQIELDALFGDVAVHPVPPHAGLGGVRRRLETVLERGTRTLTKGRSCHADAER